MNAIPQFNRRGFLVSTAAAAPSVLNAIFRATGKRIRNLPVKNHDLAKA